MVEGALFSQDRKYRYQLWRIWNGDLKVAMCVGLNPSTANEANNDPTIARLVNTLTDLGYGGFYMVNLYGFIASKPIILFNTPDPVGSNDLYVANAALNCQDIIFCWGSFKGIDYRAKKMIEKFPDGLCFGKTKDGYPWHPLAMMYAGMKRGEARLSSYKTDLLK